MIKRAKTPEQKEKCFKYLEKMGSLPVTDLYFYYEKDGEILAVAGLEICTGDTTKICRLEPMEADNDFVSLQLFRYVEGFADCTGATHIICMTNKKRTQDILQNKFNYSFWADSLNNYIKEV